MEKSYLAMPDKQINEMRNLQTGSDRMAMVRRSPEDIAASGSEHAAFARDAVNRNLMMAPALAVATPAYAAAKFAKENSVWAKDFLNYTGLVNADATPPSMSQVLAAYGGIASGVGDRALQAKKSVLDFFAPQQSTGQK